MYRAYVRQQCTKLMSDSNIRSLCQTVQSLHQTAGYTESTSGNSVQSLRQAAVYKAMSDSSIQSLRQTAVYRACQAAAVERAYVRHHCTEPTSGSNSIKSLRQTAEYRACIRQQYTEPTSNSSIQNTDDTPEMYVRQTFSERTFAAKNKQQ